MCLLQRKELKDAGKASETPSAARRRSEMAVRRRRGRRRRGGGQGGGRRGREAEAVQILRETSVFEGASPEKL